MTDSVWIRPETEYRSEQYFGAAMWSRIFAYVAVVVSAQILRWSLYVSHGFDLGFYQQALAAWVHHGFGAQSTYFPGNVLGHNGAWLMPLIAYPATWLGTGFLFLMESFVMALGYIPIVRMARLWEVTPNQARLLGVFYLLSPLLIAGNLYDFHISMLAAPILLWSLASAWESRLWPFTAALILLTGLGIHAVLAGVLLAAVVITKHGLKPFSWLALGVVVLWIGLLHHFLGTPVTAGILPRDGGVQFHLSARSGLYSLWVFMPWLLWIGMGWRHSRFYASPYWIFPLLDLAAHLLSNNLAQTSPFDQTSALMVPFLLWAAIDTARHYKPWPRSGHLVITVALVGMLGVMAFDFYHSAWRVRPHNAQALTMAVSHVARHHWIYAQNNVLPHLGMTAHAIPLSRLDLRHIPPGAEILWDTQFEGHTTPPAVYAYLANLVHSHRVKIVFQTAGVYVLQTP